MSITPQQQDFKVKNKKRHISFLQLLTNTNIQHDISVTNNVLVQKASEDILTSFL